jgi:hypothetical protein
VIIVNGVPKSGTTMIVSYLTSCGLALEPGGLVADPGEPLTMTKSGPWPKVRSRGAVLKHRANDRVIGAHVHAGIDLWSHPVVFVFRHPRNVLISWARWVAVGLDWTNAAEPAPGDVLVQIDAAAIDRTLDRMRAFVGWRDRAVFSIRFVDYVENPKAVSADLCAALGIAPVDPMKAFGDRAPWVTQGYRGTWSGRHSDWRALWTEELDKAWSTAGGPDVERLYGYA